MADEVRRSGRATKGQHTKNVETKDATPSKKGAKGGRSRSTKKEEEIHSEEDADAIIRCICGYVEEDEDDDRVMIVCDSCEAWQHNECMEVSENTDDLPDQYFCEKCKPKDHRELLAKVARGERPWEERAKQREREEEERKARRRKGGKRGKKGRSSEVKVDDVKPPGTPVPASSPIVEPTLHPPIAAPIIPPILSTETPATPTPPATLPPAAVSLISDSLPEGRVENSQKRKLPIETETGSTPIDEPEPSSKVRKISTPAEAKQPLSPVQRRKSGGFTTPLKRDSKGMVLQTELVGDISELQSEPRRKVAAALVKLFVDQTQQAQKQGAFNLPHGQTPDAFGLRLGLAVEYAMYLNFWGTSAEQSPLYGEKFRMIFHNVKANPSLRDRLLSGSLSPNEFSKMDSFAMASKELQAKTTEMMKEAEKQHVIVQEELPRIRRTHKGEELVGDDSHQTAFADQVYSQPIVRRRDTDVESIAPKPATPEAKPPLSPSAGEPSENMIHPTAAGSPSSTQPLSIDTKAMSRPSTGAERKSSAVFNINDVWSSVSGPDHERQRAHQAIKPVESSNTAIQPFSGPQVEADAEIDNLLNDEEPDEEEPYSPTEYGPDSGSFVWRGKMTMPGVAEFSGVAKHVAGANLSSTFPWTQLIPNALSIEGRIDVDRASAYLCGLRWSHTSDVSVVSITSNSDSENRMQFDKLFKYFTGRKRYGVVGRNPLMAVKDTYLVPLEAGMSKKPDFIELLEHCTIEDPTLERMLLLTFVIKSINSPSTQVTPRHHDMVTAASPISNRTFAAPNSRLPRNRPDNFAASPPYPQQSYAGPRGMEAARQALGDLANVPSVGQLLIEAPNTGVPEFQVIKDILENVPAARDNFSMLKGMLTVNYEQGGGQ